MHEHLRGTACGNGGRQDVSEAICVDLFLKETFFKLQLRPSGSLLSPALYSFVLLAICTSCSCGKLKNFSWPTGISKDWIFAGSGVWFDFGFFLIQFSLVGLWNVFQQMVMEF